MKVAGGYVDRIELRVVSMAINYEQLRNWHFEDRTDNSNLDTKLNALTLGYALFLSS